VIVVIGGTGRLGRLVAAQLLEVGETVRVVARKAPDLEVPGAEFVAADVRHPQTLVPALVGADVVVSAMHGMDPAAGQSPAEVDRDGNLNLIAAARQAGVDIVLLSVVDAATTHPMELFRMKAAAEDALRAGPDDWTIVRASAFAEGWSDILRGTAGRNGVPKVFGRGENPINFVAVHDVAVAVLRAARDETLRGQVIDVGGDDLTLTQLAQLATGQARVSRIPRAALRVMGLLLARIRPAQARLARTALLMDTLDMRFDAGPSRATRPWLPRTAVAQTLGTPTP
jgi:NADH dehydrogenase